MRRAVGRWTEMDHLLRTELSGPQAVRPRHGQCRLITAVSTISKLQLLGDWLRYQRNFAVTFMYIHSTLTVESKSQRSADEIF